MFSKCAFYIKVLLLFSIGFTYSACKKSEGKGGQASIKGVLFGKNVNNINSTALPELDEDVYIIYGDGTTYSDKTRTSGDGSFEFKFLQAGKYRLFAYGLNPNNSGSAANIAVYKDVTINSRKEVVTISDFIVYKKTNDGTNTLKGKLLSKNAFTPNSNDFLPEADEDVYIIYGNGTQYDDRVRTTADGSFQFTGLKDGNFKIYAYSVDTTSPSLTGSVAIYKSATISGANATVDAGNLIVYKTNNGSAKITGKLISRNAYNAGTNFKDSLPEPNEKVYIAYGNSTQPFDDVETAPDGSFEFSGLRTGNYKIFSYSLDTSGPHPSGVLAIYKSINISNNNATVNTGNLVIYKDADKDGLAVINGRIFAKHFNSSFTQLQYQGAEPDWDVYIKFGTGTASYNDRVKTDGTGNFQFRNLRQGIYTIYALSDTTVNINNGTTRKFKVATITVKNQTVALGDINISRN